MSCCQLPPKFGMKSNWHMPKCLHLARIHLFALQVSIEAYLKCHEFSMQLTWAFVVWPIATEKNAKHVGTSSQAKTCIQQPCFWTRVESDVLLYFKRIYIIPFQPELSFDTPCPSPKSLHPLNQGPQAQCSPAMLTRSQKHSPHLLQRSKSINMQLKRFI